MTTDFQNSMYPRSLIREDIKIKQHHKWKRGLINWRDQLKREREREREREEKENKLMRNKFKASIKLLIYFLQDLSTARALLKLRPSRM